MATEKRLIDANEIEDLFYKQVEYGATDLMDAFDDALQDALTVDAVEVVHGRWIHTAIEDDDWGGTFHKWTCSNCDFSTGRNPNGTNYCPNCGAKMDEKP